MRDYHKKIRDRVDPGWRVRRLERWGRIWRRAFWLALVLVFVV